MIKERMILGEDCIYNMDCEETGCNNNVLVCGGSGSGKTMSISEARLLETKISSLIAVVTKRKIVGKYTPLFQDRGYSVLDLNFADPEKSDCSYDPLSYVKKDTDIIFLARAIVKSDPQKDRSHADPYWDEAAISLLSAEIAYTLRTKEHASFADVLELHDGLVLSENRGTIQTSLDFKFEMLAGKEPGCFAVSCWRSFKSLPIRTAGCVFGTLNTMLDTMFPTEIRNMIRKKNSVSLETIADYKTVLFVTTSAVNPALHCLVNVFYAQAFQKLFEYAECCPGGRLPLSVHVLCDDFATGSCILNFPDYISVFREKGISVTILLQSESQLIHLYGPEHAMTIINNCDSYVYLGGMDLKTAQHVSLRWNKPLYDVLYMPIGQELLFRRGQPPICTKRYEITKDEVYQSITDKEGENQQSHL